MTIANKTPYISDTSSLEPIETREDFEKELTLLLPQFLIARSRFLVISSLLPNQCIYIFISPLAPPPTRRFLILRTTLRSFSSIIIISIFPLLFLLLALL